MDPNELNQPCFRRKGRNPVQESISVGQFSFFVPGLLTGFSE